jgi:hypothetical protein
MDGGTYRLQRIDLGALRKERKSTNVQEEKGEDSSGKS